VKAQCAIRGIGTPNGTAGVRISWRNSSDTEISTTTGNTTTGNASNGSYVTGTAPTGAMFAHVECAFASHTVGQYTVDNFWAAQLPDSMDQVPDGTTRFGAIEAGADKTSGKPLSSLSGRTMDYIGDSATRFAAAQAGADKTSSNTAADTAKVNGVASSSISPIGALMPAEAGAEKTTGKPLSILSGRTMDVERHRREGRVAVVREHISSRGSTSKGIAWWNEQVDTSYMSCGLPLGGVAAVGA